MKHFEKAPEIELTDPLAELLGATRPGEPIVYRYEDAVKLAGHSCPTVASAWLAAAAGLRALYPSGRPVRGGIEVTVGGARDDGSAGPRALVFSLVTGAAPETGFHGLMGRERRADLLRFDESLAGRVRFERTDTNEAVLVSVDAAKVPAAPELGRLLATLLAGRATPAERERFGELWQGRVAAMFEQAPRIVSVTSLTSAR